MTIQKKSLISNLKTTKKAIVASAPSEAASVSAASKSPGKHHFAAKKGIVASYAQRRLDLTKR